MLLTDWEHVFNKVAERVIHVIESVIFVWLARAFLVRLAL